MYLERSAIRHSRRLAEGSLKIALLMCVCAAALLAQYPGQYPPGQYPPGQYPPGQYPGRGPRVPLPSRGSKKDQKDAPAVKHTYSGVIRAVDAGGKSIDVETSDTRIITFELSDQTTKPAALKTGDGVDVEATQDDNGGFHAVNIQPNAAVAKKIIASDRVAEADAPAPPEPEGRTAAPPTILERPDQKYEQGDSGPPKLKRGVPGEYSAQAKRDRDREQAAAPASAAENPRTVGELSRPGETEAPKPASIDAPKPVDSRKAFIEKARGVASAYIENLPNYVCQEFATRYFTEGHTTSWNVVDVVSAEVVYENHKESYRNIAINGKATKKAPEETGAWSTGEFGTILRRLFEPWTDANFRYAQSDTIAHQTAFVYKFAVERQRSNWKVWTTGQYIIPSYKGSVWLDKENANALRIEMQATNIPEEFPLVSVESAIDYQYVTLGTPEKFLLPVRAEVLSCERASNRCERNVIEFRNYHKFTGQSTIKFNEQQ